MAKKVGIGSDGGDVAETLFAWNSENNKENIGYKVRKKKRSNVRIPKTTGCGPLYWQNNQEVKPTPR